MSTTLKRPTALIAEDEPLLATALSRLLAQVWPELEIVARCQDGVDATERALELAPDVMFLDIRMPGKTGLEVAEAVADEWPEHRAEPLFVFVTAHDEFAVSAFERAAVDYLLKPATAERLQKTVERLRQRLADRAAEPGDGEMATVFRRMQSLSTTHAEPMERIKTIRAGVGNTVRMIPVTDVICFEAADKYVNVITAAGQSLVRMSLRELVSRIDAADFVQVHRSVMVNSSYITSATRDELGHCTLSLRGLSRPVKVSRAFSYLFRPM
jgi:DNA-binding LytR/AlgR family response regulator